MRPCHAGTAASAKKKTVPAPISFGGQPSSAFHFCAVLPALYLLERCDHASNNLKPSALPHVAANSAMPTRFQLSQSQSSFGTIAIANVSSAMLACGSPSDSRGARAGLVTIAINHAGAVAMRRLLVHL